MRQLADAAPQLFIHRDNTRHKKANTITFSTTASIIQLIYKENPDVAFILQLQQYNQSKAYNPQLENYFPIISSKCQ